MFNARCFALLVGLFTASIARAEIMHHNSARIHGWLDMERPVDLDQDGIPEFQIKGELLTCDIAGGCGVIYVMTWRARTGVEILLESPNSFGVHPSELGESIGALSGTNRWWDFMIGISRLPVDVISWREGWNGPVGDVNNRYLGVRFATTSGLHYAWIRLISLTTTSIPSAAVEEWAYETQPGVSIRAGETSIPALNDAFANRIRLAGDAVEGTGNNIASSVEWREPDHAGTSARASLWWTWTASNSGWVTLSTSQSAFTPCFAVYRGTALTNLEVIAHSSERSTGAVERPFPSSIEVFLVKSGETYQIALDSSRASDQLSDLSNAPRGQIRFSLVLTPLGGSPGHPLDYWKVESMTGLPKLRGPTVYSGGLLAVGTGGNVFLSKTGREWIAKSTGVTNHLRKALIFKGRIMLAGSDGLILTSPDAEHWTRVPTGVTNTLHALAKSSETLVAVGENGIILKSNDGMTWSSRQSQPLLTLWDIDYGVGMFVAVGDDGITLSSRDDAQSWKQEKTAASGASLAAVKFGNDRWVAAGPMASDLAFGRSIITTSLNGSDWTAKDDGRASWLWDIEFAENTFVIVGSSTRVSTMASPTLLTSTNGLDWISRTMSRPADFHDIIFFNRRFIATGDLGLILLSGPFIHLEPGQTRPPSLSIEAAVGESYVLEICQTLSNVWSSLAVVSLTNSTQSVAVPRINARLFFRARLQ